MGLVHLPDTYLPTAYMPDSSLVQQFICPMGTHAQQCGLHNVRDDTPEGSMNGSITSCMGDSYLKAH